MDALKLIAQDSVKTEIPQFEVGDTIRIDVNIREGDRERIQVFEGTVIARKGSGISETFTVRRVSYGVGVERVFPLHSPNVKGIKIVRKGRVLPARQSRQGREGQGTNQISIRWKKGHVMSLFCLSHGEECLPCS